MARSSEQILESFKTSVELSDPSADREKGPLYSLFMKPASPVLADTEARVDELEQLYSVDFAKTATADQASAFITNWGQAAGEGSPSRVRIFFMKFSKPAVDEVIRIAVGSLVSNRDQSLQYRVIEEGVINGAIADSYYNPQRRTFEIGLNCVAVANSTDYDLPKGRINTVVSAITGIDACENREDAAGGIAAESTQSQVESVQQKFLGTAVNNGSGIGYRIKRYNPTAITDVKTIVSSNRKLFRRPVLLPGMDHYILATLPTATQMTYQSTLGGETFIQIDNVPVLSVSQVKLNNVPTSLFSFVPDSTLELRKSFLASDRIYFSTPLIAGDVVVVDYIFDSIIPEVQVAVLSDTKLFSTDELARLFIKVPLIMEFSGKVLPSYEPSTVEQSMRTELQKLIEPGVWAGTYDPEIIRQNLRTNAPGLSQLTVTKFKRSTLATADIQTVVIEDNELAAYDDNLVVIKLKKV